MKLRLVNTALGPRLLDLRDRLALYRTTLMQPEALGTAANDYLARVLLERLCLPGRTFLDVGAHIGSVIAGVRRHSRPGRIVAVEAIPAKAARLRASFPGVDVQAVAVGDMEGEVPFFIDLARPGYSSLDGLAVRAGAVEEIRVPLRRLDDVVAARDVDMMKIDVEGHELAALRGAGAIVAASRPTILFESGPNESAGLDKEALWRWFADAGYAVVVPNRLAHHDDGLSLDGFVEAHLYPRRTTNYFGVARERRADVRARARAVLGLHDA